MIKMNKLVIPTILAFSVLIAGAFAFVPVDKATTVHPKIIAAVEDLVAGVQDDILLDLENKTKLSSDIDTSNKVSFGGVAKVFIKALDGSQQETTFNLKECYLTGTSDNSGSDDVQVTALRIDGKDIFTGTNQAFSSFGPWNDFTGISGRAQVEVITGLGFHSGLGAADEITMDIQVDTGDEINFVKCIAFVQNSADLDVVINDQALD